MKEGRSLANLALELERQADAKRDFVVATGDGRVHTNGSSALPLIRQDETYPLNEIAHGQIADYAEMPKLFYDRLRSSSMTLRVPTAETPVAQGKSELQEPTYSEPFGSTDCWPARVGSDEPLFDLVINRLLQEKREVKRLVRTLDGRARAFLSSSFDPDMDNFDVFRVAAKVLSESGLTPENVVSCEMTERKLYLKVVTPQLQATIEPSNLTRPQSSFHYLKEPQLVQAGFILTNSETGPGALKVETVVMKLMCTNLFITETSYRKRHPGRMLDADEDGHIYRSDTRAADAKARLLKLRDHVSEALDEHRFLALVGKMQDATEIPLSSNIEKSVEATGRKFGLSQSEREAVVRNLIEVADLSMWGLSNAITQTAGMVDSYDRATEIETIGGKMFSLSPMDLKEIVNA